MKTPRATRRILASILTAATCLVIRTAEGADDTAVFSTAVPPNVLLLIDTSLSMNEIMYHPAADPANATCQMFGWLAPGTNPPSGALPVNGSGTMNDQNGVGTPYNCDPNTRHCRFEIAENMTGFTSTGTVTCDAPPAGNQCGTGAGAARTTCQSGYLTRKFCGKTRRMYIDGETACRNNKTWWSEYYDEWYFSPAADPYFGGLAEGNTSTADLIDADQNGTHYIDGTPYPLYKKSRITAAKEVARDVLFRVDTNCTAGTGNRSTLFCPAGDKNAVRFGIAKFNGSNGGFVTTPIDPYTTNKAALDATIDNFDADDSTPSAESLFKSYTYFMSRNPTNLPLGVDGATKFPAYAYNTIDGANSGTIPPDPLDCDETTPGLQPCSCQKNFVIFITDGAPNNDKWECDNGCASPSRTLKFNVYDNLIGDYAPDLATDPPGIGNPETGAIVGGNGYLYLDDVAKYMHDKDFRPDLPGNQTLDIYTVGFETPVAAENLLQRTADNGNGQFYKARTAGDVSNALVSAINDIIQKSQSFTAATVPASRTADGGNFYVTQFVPSNSDPFWKGELLNFEITVDGKIKDSTGACALSDPDQVRCESGTIKTTAVPFWNAANQIPLPGARTLRVSVGATDITFDTGGSQSPAVQLNAASLGVTYPPAAPYPLSTALVNGGATNATKAEWLSDEITSYVRGCAFGSGVGAIPCVARTVRLGDIFHSNPVVVGQPTSVADDPAREPLPVNTFSQFRTANLTRDRVIYAGANDGFLHAFHAGTWRTVVAAGVPNPPGYDRGTGTELFGFMPWAVRQTIKELPIDTNGRNFYFVDGTPKAADVWFYPTPTSPKRTNVSEWHTILVGGLRQGGRQYYALDVTNPAAANYGRLLWEYPRESDPATVTDYVGETWSEPVITRVKVAVGSNDNGGQGFERWVAIVAGGYDVTGDPNSAFYDATSSGTTKKFGRAIFMIDVETGQVLAEKKYDPSAALSDPERQMRYAIPSTPAVFDLDFDGYADVIYVGDLGGNLWKWVIGGIGRDVDSDGLVFDDETTPTPYVRFRKFFAAPVFAGVHYRSFYFPPAGTLKNGNLYLAFGSGERTELKYQHVVDVPPPPAIPSAATDDNNRFYVMRDLDPYERETTPLDVITENNPDPTRSLTDILAVDQTGATCPNLTTPGYFLRAADDEKFVTNSVIFASYVFTSSFKPTVSTDPCIAGGTASLYAFRVECAEGFFDPTGSGQHRTLALGTGVPTDPRVSISAGDPTAGGGSAPCAGGHANKVFVITSDNSVQNNCTPPLPGSGVGLMYWRERQ